MEPKHKRTSRFDVRRSNVTACNRCKSRKQRCDQRLPACSNCDRAGVECVGYDAVAGRLAPRSYLHKLEERVAYLEQKLILNRIPVDNTSESQSCATSETRPGEDESVSHQRQGEEHRSLPRAQPEPQPQPQLQTQPQRSTATSFPPLMCDVSETWLISVLLSDLGLDIQSTNWSSAHSSGSYGTMNQIFSTAPLDILFDLDVANKLASVYFEHCDSFLLVLHRHQFLADLTSVHETSSTLVPSGAEHKYFRYFMVMAIALLLMVKTDASTPWTTSERLLASAMSILSERPKKILTFDLNQLEAITLLAQYASLHPRSTGASHTIGLALRFSIDLGLHNEASLPPTVNFLETERRRRLFWAVYSLEINICIALGRPPAVLDEAITTEYPAGTDDVNITENGITQQESPSRKLSAIWVLRVRRLEYEIQARLYFAPPRGYAPLEISEWRANMASRLRALYDSRPSLPLATKLAPTDIFNGFFNTTLVYLMMPTKQYPTVSASVAVFLVNNAVRSINSYRDAFRSGTLRFYWRATNRLFHCGSALLYCIAHVADLNLSVSTPEIQSAINTCSAVLWGMAERYPSGKSYRDLFDQMAQSVNAPGVDNLTALLLKSNQELGILLPSSPAPVVPFPTQTSEAVVDNEFDGMQFIFTADEDGPLRYMGIFS